MVELFVVFLLVGPAIIAAILCGFLAKGRGRSAIKWGLIGAIIAFLASVYRSFTVEISGMAHSYSIPSVVGFDYGMVAAFVMLLVCHIFTSAKKPEKPATQQVEVASGFGPVIHAGQPMHDLGGGKFKVGFRTFKNIVDAKNHAEWLSQNP